MDPKLLNVVIEELRTLLAETEAGQEPSNVWLSEVVWNTVAKTNPVS